MTAAVSVLAMEDARPRGAVTEFDDSDSEAWIAALRARPAPRATRPWRAFTTCSCVRLATR